MIPVLIEVSIHGPARGATIRKTIALHRNTPTGVGNTPSVRLWPVRWNNCSRPGQKKYFRKKLQVSIPGDLS